MKLLQLALLFVRGDFGRLAFKLKDRMPICFLLAIECAGVLLVPVRLADPPTRVESGASRSNHSVQSLSILWKETEAILSRFQRWKEPSAFIGRSYSTS
ncbi:hypothetical protein [Paenibacillus methanolicus]|uniref:Uncharacterized protein n=1 Tax=Paenibacillus methanolicus TaxID=582686 RepID=A0A5S5CFS7_9BACL|nr:hypothetical protein [Paenibacillus methanolicus]TYP78261.1 hypothetical protein BCM02_102838 [Paenibacillus methanolicus]